MTWRMAEALRDGRPLCLLASIDHPSGLFRCWTGIGTLDYGGYEWTGTGVLGQVAPVKAVTDLAIQEVRFTMSGVTPEVIARLEYAVRKRTAQVWLAALNDQGQIIPDPYQLLDCEMDTQELKAEEDGTVTITIIARSGFYSLERAIDEVWSDQDQQRRYPGDTGLADLASLQNQDVIWSPDEPYLVQQFLVAIGPIDAIEAIYIGTDRLNFPDGITPNTILTPSSVIGQPNYPNYVRCCVRLGAEDQTRCPLIAARFPSVTADFRQRGIATVTMEFKHPGDFESFQALYGNVRTPNVFFVVRGAPIYDPRDPGHDIDDADTWAFSNNASLVEANYLMADYGGRIDPDRMDWDRIIASADYDQSPMGTDEGEFIARHTIDGLVTLNQRPVDVMGTMLSANRGAIVQEGGRTWISSSKPKTPVLTVTDDLLCGGLQYQPFKNRRELINIVEPRFIASERNYETVPGPEWRDTDLIEAHGEPLPTALNLPFTLDHRRCQRLTKLFGLSAQLEKSVAISLDLKAMAQATGPLTDGVITLQSELFSQANGQYEIRTMGFSEGFASIEIAAVQYDGSIENDWDPSVDQKPFVETDIEA